MPVLLAFVVFHLVYSPHESVGVCFYRRWFVCLSVTMITRKTVDGFAPIFTGRFLGGKGDCKFVFCYNR